MPWNFYVHPFVIALGIGTIALAFWHCLKKVLEILFVKSVIQNTENKQHTHND
jgi:hypothetical protein